MTGLMSSFRKTKRPIGARSIRPPPGPKRARYADFGDLGPPAGGGGVAGWGVLGAASQRRDRLAQTHGIMATTSNPNDYDPPDMAAKRRELELVEQRGDVLHFPAPIPP